MSAQKTGRTRYRVAREGWRGKTVLVLQVEWTGSRLMASGPFIDDIPFTEWRDARPEDVTEATGKEV